MAPVQMVVHPDIMEMTVYQNAVLIVLETVPFVTVLLVTAPRVVIKTGTLRAVIKVAAGTFRIARHVIFQDMAYFTVIHASLDTTNLLNLVSVKSVKIVSMTIVAKHPGTVLTDVFTDGLNILTTHVITSV